MKNITLLIYALLLRIKCSKIAVHERNKKAEKNWGKAMKCSSFAAFVSIWRKKQKVRPERYQFSKWKFVQNERIHYTTNSFGFVDCNKCLKHCHFQFHFSSFIFIRFRKLTWNDTVSQFLHFVRRLRILCKYYLWCCSGKRDLLCCGKALTCEGWKFVDSEIIYSEFGPENDETVRASDDRSTCLRFRI